jgi:hypothetical protein
MGVAEKSWLMFGCLNSVQAIGQCELHNLAMWSCQTGKVNLAKLPNNNVELVIWQSGLEKQDK